jgi:hypothetical protein
LTADEIRKYKTDILNQVSEGFITDPSILDKLLIEAVFEIAAQLAERNEQGNRKADPLRNTVDTPTFDKGGYRG